jgi:hypothetical protein
MFRRLWSISIVTCAVLLLSATLASAEALRALDPVRSDPGNLVVLPHRGAFLPVTPGSPASTSEPGDDDAPNKDGSWVGSNPVLDEAKGTDWIQAWSFRNLGTSIRLRLLKYFAALR